MKKFEYKIVLGSVDVVPERDEEILNSEGKEGWELVFYVEAKARDYGLGAKRFYYFMKREISDSK